MALNSEIVRFSKDVATKESLLAELKKVGTDHAALVEFANSKGYTFTLADVEGLSSSMELSDAVLESVTGGMVFFIGDNTRYAFTSYHKAFVWYPDDDERSRARIKRF